MAALLGVRLLGFIYLFMGIVGFLPFPDLNPMHTDGVGAQYLLNMIAVNGLHNGIHLVLGLTALFSAQTTGSVRRWGLSAGSALIGLFIAGITQAIIGGFPTDQMLLGLLPLNSPGHMFHLVTGCIGLSIGLSIPPHRPTEQSSGKSLAG